MAGLLNLCFDLYFKYDRIGRIEIKNNKLVKNEVYTDQLLLRPYARVKDAFTMVQLLRERVMCEERWDAKQLNHIGLTGYNFFKILKITHGVDIDDFFWLKFDGENTSYDDIKVTFITKGSQVKYLKDGYFYKLNKHGNEGLTEYLVYTLLKHSTLAKELVLSYEYCYINKKLGCRSGNFLSADECFYTMEHLFSTVTGKHGLAEVLASFSSAAERLEYILDIIESLGFPRQDYRNYMQVLMQVDLLAENCDRHVHNYGLIFKDGVFRLPPVFDNGLSLKTDREKYSAACTLSGSFIEQVTVFGFPVEPAFLINYDTLLPELENIKLVHGDKTEIKVLENNLQEYKDIFALENKRSGHHVRKFECTSDDVKRIIKNIDNSIAVKDEYIESPVFGGMAPERLSTGCKVVILMAVLEKPYIYATKCGDNCVPDMLDIAKTKDVHINLHHIMEFPKDGFEAVMADSGKRITTFDGFAEEYYRIREGRRGLVK